MPQSESSTTQPPLLDVLLDSATRLLVGEGERLVRARAVEAARGGLEVIRKLLLLQYALIFCIVLFSLSVFGLLWFGVWMGTASWMEVGVFRVGPPAGFLAGLALASGLPLGFLARRATWARLIPDAASELQRPFPSDEEELARLVARVVDERLARERQSQGTPATSVSTGSLP
jgi:hypothetical protein